MHFVWLFESGKSKFVWMPLIPGAFYTFICSTFIANAAIGFNLPWAIAYPIGAVLMVVYVIAIVTYGKKRAARLLCSTKKLHPDKSGSEQSGPLLRAFLTPWVWIYTPRPPGSRRK